jgi:hypothetical protein
LTGTGATGPNRRFDRELQTSTIFGRRCALPKQEWRVDLLDVDAAILLGLLGGRR